MFDVITVGTATRDVFLQSPFFRVLKDPAHLKKIGFPTGEAQCFALGGKLEVSEPIFTTGGGATNTAFTFRRQGLKTATLIKIGEDDSARQILQELKKEKIKTFAVKEKKRGTAYSVVLLAPGGERTILVYRGASEDLKPKEVPWGKLRSRWAYISPGRIPFSLTSKIFNHFAKKGTLIAFNPSSSFIEMGLKKLRPLLTKTKVVILNHEEAASLTGIDYGRERKIFKKIDEAVPGIVVMTDGPKGVMVSDGYHIYQAETFKEEAVLDRTGAGDAFGSGFVAGLIQKREKCEKGKCRGDNIAYAIRLGSANATSVIERIGAKAGILTRYEFEKPPRFKTLEMKLANIII